MPLKRKTRKQKNFCNSPWITAGLRKSIDEKDRLYSLSKKDPSLIPKWKEHSNMLKKLKRQAELLYDRERIAKYGNDKSKTWQLINNIMKRKKKSRTVIKSLRDKNGVKISEPNEIANCLNDHFSTVVYIVALDI